MHVRIKLLHSMLESSMSPILSVTKGPIRAGSDCPCATRPLVSGQEFSGISARLPHFIHWQEARHPELVLDCTPRETDRSNSRWTVRSICLTTSMVQQGTSREVRGNSVSRRLEYPAQSSPGRPPENSQPISGYASPTRLAPARLVASTPGP